MRAIVTKKKFTFTGSTAQKKVQELNAELTDIYSQERQISTYTYLDNETPEIPNYDIELVQSKFETIVANIGVLKAALRKFNQEHRGRATGLSVDEILVMMPMVNHRKSILSNMRQRIPTTRTTRQNVSEYTKINYSLDDANRYYQENSDLLVALQEDLNYLNVTDTFEVELGVFEVNSES